MTQAICSSPSCQAEEAYYGGSPFNIYDPSTHWCEPHQLFTWWKNNVERRTKFKVLQDDASYKDTDIRKMARYSMQEKLEVISCNIRYNFFLFFIEYAKTYINPGFWTREFYILSLDFSFISPLIVV